MTKNSKILVSILLALGAVRFVLMPVVDHQSELLLKRQELLERINASQQLLENEAQFKESAEHIERVVQNAKDAFPTFYDSGEFRFEFQKNIEKLAKTYGVSVTRSDWVGLTTEENETPGVVKREEFSLFIRGHALAVVELQRSLSQLDTEVQVNRFYFKVSEYGNEPLEVLDGSMTMSVYYRVENEQ